MRNMFANLCLVFVSCVVGLALCEVSLRLFYPKYRHLADAQFRRDAERIYSRPSHQRSYVAHPDTGSSHPFFHNNLALRQHRNFSEADLASSINIGIFGDSYVENIRMAAQYSFTEPLDYLLNQHGEPFNVLNFGVDGYGPGQSLLHYEHFRYAEDLDHVFYVYCENDLWDIYETGLFHLDEAGHLVRDEAIRESWGGFLLRRLHIPYLVLDVSGRESPLSRGTLTLRKDLKWRREERRSDETSQVIRTAFRQGRLVHDGPKNTLEIFRQLIRRWKHVADRNGSTFSVVLLPSHPPQPFVVDLLTAEAVEVIDLNDCFRNIDPAHTQRLWAQSPYRFKHDPHWNERGNRLAAVCLYRLLEDKTGVPRLSEGRLQEALSRYYAAFKGDLPEGRRGTKNRSLIETASIIREKYLAIDSNNPWKDMKEEILEVVAQSDKRTITSDFDVYLDQNQVIYIKENCSPADMEATFFLHVIPVDDRDLFAHRRKHGFDNWDFSWDYLKLDDRRCFAKGQLPAYPIRQISTGQYVKNAQGNYVPLWKGEFSTAQDSRSVEPRAGN